MHVVHLEVGVVLFRYLQVLFFEESFVIKSLC